MARKDIPDWVVCAAYVESQRRRETRPDGGAIVWPSDILMEWTQQPEKVCFAAMERSDERGYIDYGVSLRAGWVTDEGAELLEAQAPKEFLDRLKQGINRLSFNVFD